MLLVPLREIQLGMLSCSERMPRVRMQMDRPRPEVQKGGSSISIGSSYSGERSSFLARQRKRMKAQMMLQKSPLCVLELSCDGPLDGLHEVKATSMPPAHHRCDIASMQSLHINTVSPAPQADALPGPGGPYVTARSRAN